MSPRSAAKPRLAFLATSTGATFLCAILAVPLFATSGVLLGGSCLVRQDLLHIAIIGDGLFLVRLPWAAFWVVRRHLDSHLGFDRVRFSLPSFLSPHLVWLAFTQRITLASPQRPIWSLELRWGFGTSPRLRGVRNGAQGDQAGGDGGR
jgi:hypothetical protein